MLGKFSRCQATGYLALRKSRVWSSRKMRKARLCPRAEPTDRGEFEYSLTKFSLSCAIRAEEGKVWGESSVSVRGRGGHWETVMWFHVLCCSCSETEIVAH